MLLCVRVGPYSAHAETFRLDTFEKYVEVLLQAEDVKRRLGMFGQPAPSAADMAEKLDKARKAANIPEAYVKPIQQIFSAAFSGSS